ncbi:EamA family transporter [Actinopolymorpha singaporensis]|uniref:EamA family transporter n=1 Tax=Actinopolymorpha singaporensis TaxID=117157 RepID=UPI000AF3628C|nr:EamA family transporter [Actinopolymorpha singaporensis]
MATRDVTEVRGPGTRGGPPAPGGEARSVGLVLGSAVSLQVGAAFAVVLLGRVGPVGAVTLRMVLAAAIVWALVRPRLRHLHRRDLLVGVAFGLVLVLMNTCFYSAVARLPLGAAVTIEFLGPLGLAVATSRRVRDLLWVGLAGAGVFLLGETGFEPLDPVGVAFALGAGVCWAGYILLGAQAGRRLGGTNALAVALAVASVAIVPAAALTSGPDLVQPDTLLLGLGVAVLSSALPYSLELAALRRIPPRTFGVLMSLEPVVAALVGFLVLRQRLSGWQLLAVTLVVVASVGVTRAGPASAATRTAEPVPGVAGADAGRSKP